MSEEKAAAECIKCVHAEWQRTAVGRIKSKSAGRCFAPIPDSVQLLCFPYGNAKPRRNGIWTDYQGRCDLFAPTTRVEGE